MTNRTPREVQGVIFLHLFLVFMTSSVIRHSSRIVSEPFRPFYDVPLFALLAFVFTKMKLMDGLVTRPPYAELSIKELRIRFGVHLALRYGAGIEIFLLILSRL